MQETPEQRDVIAFLSTPAAYGLSGGSVDRIDTHISVVFLAGERVYKLKRSVRFDYVDFSTLDRRHEACEAEIRLNRRTAPSLYLRVVPVTRESSGSLALGGQGVAVDWLVEMVRFDQDTLFDRLAERHELDIGLMDGLADAIARLHAQAEPRLDRGGRDGMAWVIEGNALGFDDQGDAGVDRAVCEQLTAAARAALDRHTDRLERRKRHGSVRRCHGDLHLGNICLIDGVPTLFDGIEFNDRIACIDVFYDLAFVLMDLWRRGLQSHANAIFNAYLARTGDFEGLALLPLFLSCRAAVRAKTSVASARVQPDAHHAGGLYTAAREYLALAVAFLHPAAPFLLAIGGFSGSGKSTLARRLAPGIGAPPGALIVRSDVVRKRLLGVSPLTRLGSEGYTPAVSRLVYRTLAEEARDALAAGHAVVVDAVFADPHERTEIAAVARDAGVPFVGLWLEGSTNALAERLRLRVGDASDATPEVLDRQRRAGTGEMEWQRLDGSGDPATVQQHAELLVGRAVRLSLNS